MVEVKSKRSSRLLIKVGYHLLITWLIIFYSGEVAFAQDGKVTFWTDTKKDNGSVEVKITVTAALFKPTEEGLKYSSIIKSVNITPDRFVTDKGGTSPIPTTINEKRDRLIELINERSSNLVTAASGGDGEVIITPKSDEVGPGGAGVVKYFVTQVAITEDGYAAGGSGVEKGVEISGGRVFGKYTLEKKGAYDLGEDVGKIASIKVIVDGRTVHAKTSTTNTGETTVKENGEPPDPQHGDGVLPKDDSTTVKDLHNVLKGYKEFLGVESILYNIKTISIRGKKTTQSIDILYDEVPSITYDIAVWVDLPTLIDLVELSASIKDTHVILNWNTEVEIDNEGFNILRSESEAGTYIKINDTLIPSKAIPPSGANYEFVDTTVESGKTYFYKLEDIDTNGTRTLHGPISFTVVEGQGASVEKDSKSSAWGGGCGFIKPAGNMRPPSNGQIAGYLLSFLLPLILLLFHRLWRYQRRRNLNTLPLQS